MSDILKYFPQHIGNQEVISELEEYQKDLDILSKRNVSIQFNNKGKDHAILVMSKIFESSFKKIKIFARDFNGDISNNELYLESLKHFLDKKQDSSIDVIFESDPNNNSKALGLLKSIQKINPDKVSIKKACANSLSEFKEYLVNDEKMIHFAIGDDIDKGFNKYRCETDTQNYIAILNFDDTKFSNTLLRLFNILNREATNIE